jgi:transcriptional regulator with XRE-family HTH domain
LWDGKRLQDLLDSKGITQVDFSKLLTVDKVSVWRWIKNKRVPSDEDKKKIAEALDTTVSFLIGETEDPSSRSDAPHVSITTRNKILQLDNLTWIPVISPEVKVSAGVGNCCEEVIWEKIDEFPLFDGKIAALYSDNGLLSIYVEGDSMEPQIHDGDLVIFKKTNEWVPGNVVVVCLDGRLMVKGILKGPEGETRLRSLNRNYEDIIIGRGSFFLVYGRVIKIVRQWDPKPVV